MWKFLDIFKKKHVHTPTQPWAVALLRANVLQNGGSFSWRCSCGEMIEDNYSSPVVTGEDWNAGYGD